MSETSKLWLTVSVRSLDQVPAQRVTKLHMLYSFQINAIHMFFSLFTMHFLNIATYSPVRLDDDTLTEQGAVEYKAGI